MAERIDEIALIAVAAGAGVRRVSLIRAGWSGNGPRDVVMYVSDRYLSRSDLEQDVVLFDVADIARVVSERYGNGHVGGRRRIEKLKVDVQKNAVAFVVRKPIVNYDHVVRIFDLEPVDYSDVSDRDLGVVIVGSNDESREAGVVGDRNGERYDIARDAGTLGYGESTGRGIIRPRLRRAAYRARSGLDTGSRQRSLSRDDPRAPVVTGSVYVIVNVTDVTSAADVGRVSLIRAGRSGHRADVVVAECIDVIADVVVAAGAGVRRISLIRTRRRSHDTHVGVVVVDRDLSGDDGREEIRLCIIADVAGGVSDRDCIRLIAQGAVEDLEAHREEQTVARIVGVVKPYVTREEIHASGNFIGLIHAVEPQRRGIIVEAERSRTDTGVVRYLNGNVNERSLVSGDGGDRKGEFGRARNGDLTGNYDDVDVILVRVADIAGSITEGDVISSGRSVGINTEMEDKHRPVLSVLSQTGPNDPVAGNAEVFLTGIKTLHFEGDVFQICGIIFHVHSERGDPRVVLYRYGE